ncbi:MAG: hypothetical protein HYZ07_02645, partial [Candidatus Harrisonbacteria bacterium]|nr:hypothetical protein [Candidatus Harrisonbacteria bacterium]
ECFAFAKANGLVREDETRQFEQGRALNRKVQEGGGPGGCKNEGECMRYCGDPNHVNECLDFAEKSGAMSREEAQRGLKQFKQVRDYGEEVRRADPSQFRPAFGPGPGGPGEFGPPGGGFGPGGPGFGPGGLRQFGPGGSQGFGPGGPRNPPPGGFGPAGFGPGGGFPGVMPQQGGQFNGPGGCTSPEECVDFCAKPENRESCVATFRRGMAPPQASEEHPQEFRGPGGCRGFEECGAYCADPGHAEQCGRFNAPPAGNMPPQEGGMPHGAPCRTPEECRALEEQPRGVMPQGGFPQPPQGRGESPERPNMGLPPCNTPEECRAIKGRFHDGSQGQPPQPQMNPAERVERAPMPPQGQEDGGFRPQFFPPGGFVHPDSEQGFTRPDGGMMPQTSPMPPQGDFAPRPFMPPPQSEGGMPSSPGGFPQPPMPMPAPMPESGGGFAPPPPALMPPPPADMPPPPPPPPPTSALRSQSFVGLIIEAMKGLLR